MSDDILAGVQRLQPIADAHGLSMAQLAVAWVLQNRNVASAIIGASRPEQVADNVKAAGVKLDADVLASIDDAIGSLAERNPELTKKSSPATREA
jgi:aryl-alcohol dehydrogenase-like predicted oxidoreductase